MENKNLSIATILILFIAFLASSINLTGMQVTETNATPYEQKNITPTETNNTVPKQENVTIQRINEEITCVDSDAGKNYTIRGNVKRCVGTECATQQDCCVPSPGNMGCKDVTNNVAERYCTTDNNILTDVHQCEYGCEVGACRKGDICKSHYLKIEKVFDEKEKIVVTYQEKEVAERSKIQLIKSRIARGGSDLYTDCLMTGSYCAYGSCTIYTNCKYPFAEKNVKLSIKISDPKCPNVYDQKSIGPMEVKCTDSDGGKNYKIKGTTYGNSNLGYRKFVDSCRTSNILDEYFCYENWAIKTGFGCKTGCKDGVCK